MIVENIVEDVELLTREDTARELSVSPWTILRWEKSGHITPAVDRGKGGVIRYSRDEVERVRQCHQKRRHWTEVA